MIETVIKRDGREEPFSPTKINGWGEWAAENLDKRLVNWSSVVLRVASTQPKVVSTAQLQEALIKTCLDFDTYEYNLMAGRLYAEHSQKELYADLWKKNPHIKDLHNFLEEKGLIAKPNYSDEEYEQINEMLDHNLNREYTYYSAKMLVDKYSLQDRVTGHSYETPQFVYMRVAMQAFNNYHKPDRMTKVKDTYELFAKRKINIPTPYLTNSLTHNPNVTSCCVLTTTDEAESIGVTNAIAYMMTVAGAGLGIHMTTRSLGDPVRGGLIEHQGKVPYYRGLAHTIRSSKQGCFDPETELFTNDGWVNVTQIGENTKVAQVLPNGTVTFVNPSEVHVYDHDGVMYKASYNKKGKEEIWSITPNHRVIYRDSNKMGEWLEVEAKDLHTLDGSIEIPTVIYGTELWDTTPTVSKRMSAIFEVMMLHGAKGEVIAKAPYELSQITDKVEFNPSIKLTQDEANIVNLGLEGFFPLDAPKNGIPAALVRDAIIYAAEELQGWDEKQSKRLQDLLSVLGYKSKAEDAEPILLKDIKQKTVEYKGKVYCVTVPSGVVYARRGGQTFVSGNSRGGMGTLYFPYFDPEIQTLISLKNPLSTTAKRLREADYNVGLNKWFVQRALKKQPVWLFSYHDAPEVYEAFYDKDPELFPKLMLEFVANHPDKVTEISAVDLLGRILTESLQTGRVYLFMADAMNQRSVYKDKIYSSNLCVAGDQLIMTDKGLLTAQELYENADANTYWNGIETVSGTKVNLVQKSARTLKITLGNGLTHTVTDYHKVLTKEGFVQAQDLLIGSQVAVNVREGIFGKGKKDEASIKFLASEALKTNTISMEIRSFDRETMISFLKAIIENTEADRDTPVSKVLYLRHSSKELMSVLQILFASLGVLLDLKALDDTLCVLSTSDEPTIKLASKLFGDSIQSIAKELYYNGEKIEAPTAQFSSVVSIEEDKEQPVYCPTVKGELFTCNGILTHNCTEIALPTKAFKSYADLYDLEKEDNGIVAFCNLAGIVVPNIESDEEYAKACYYALHMIDSGIENSILPFPVLNKSIRDWRSAGVGILGLAHLMAKKGLSYTSQEGRNFMFTLGETHAWHLYNAALKLGKEFGNAPMMHRTLFPEGWLPFDTANQNVLDLVTVEKQRDWESLRQAIKDNGGIRFTTVSTIPPSESCLSKSTVVQTSDGDLSLEQILTDYCNMSLEEALHQYEGPTVGGYWAPLLKELKTASNEPITHVWVNGPSTVTEIEMEDGTIVKATENHKFKVKTEDGDEVFKTIYDLVEGDELVVLN